MLCVVEGMIFLLLSLILITVTTTPCCFAAPVEDLVDSLPLFGPPPTRHYSGYLDATAGCNTTANGAYCKIHYWFAAAAEGPHGGASKPVVLWLNGGPGASSIIGLLQENGPLLINATGRLMVNPYSWTAVANVLVLESPVGVGYSYCEAQVNGGICENTDTFTASAARAALTDFFHHKFPELAANDFFITGESYAGVYIPTLAYEILQYNNARNPDAGARINLQGLAVGDPCTDNAAQRESMDVLWYSHKYGLVDDAVYETLRSSECNVRIPNALMRNDQQHGGAKNKEATRTTGATEYMARHLPTSATASAPDSCTLAIRKYMLSSSRGIAGKWSDHYIDRYSLFAPVTNVVDVAMEKYMNRPDVRAALHIDESVPVTTWTLHADYFNFDYTKEYDACNHFVKTDDALSMIDFYRKIVPQLQAVWIYNGDTDPAVSYEGTRTAVKRIGFPEVDGGGYRPWFYNHTAAPLAVLQEKAVMFGPDLLLLDTGAQFGGEVVNYEHGLAFLTVHGSGHMVPQFRPQAALHMITKLLQHGQELLSPLLPTNATLLSMNDTEFAQAMDQWTERAKAAPYIVAD